jgi:putative ABC transport system substrate-binding protein
MRRLALTLALMLLVVYPHAGDTKDEQQARATYRIGYLGTFRPTPKTQPVADAFVQGLRERGWIEGENVVVERRFPEGNSDRLARFAAELVQMKPHVIVAPGTLQVRAVRELTSTIPIVTVLIGDPVGAGFAASLARPAGNVTGMSSQASELTGKSLDLLRAVVPAAARIAVMWNPSNPSHQVPIREVQAAVGSHALSLLSLEVRTGEDLEPAFTAITRERASAVQVFDDPVTATHRQKIVEFANRHRLPAIYLWRYYIEAGGLMAYGPNLPDLFRRAGGYVDKILRGARPGDLPIEQPTKFELIVNQRTARAIGVTIPQDILLRADEIIE